MDKKLVGLAALASAALASVCCLGPFVVTGLGLGSLGLAAGLSKHRPLFLAMTGIVLTVAFYLAYRKRPADGKAEPEAVSRAVEAAGYKAELLNGAGHEQP